MHQYATTTPEARELVSELEFVWDQIKSNSCSSSLGSTPGKFSGRERQQSMQPSYASLMGQGRGEGLKVLRPFSDEDEEEEEDDDDEADFRDGRRAGFGDGAEVAAAEEPRIRDLDVRNRKWRKRIESALVKMTVELAALREQVEAKRTMDDGRRRNGLWAWISWLLWVSVRHLAVDVSVLAFVIFWARKRGDRRLERGLGFLVLWGREQVGRLRVSGVSRTQKG